MFKSTLETAFCMDFGTRPSFGLGTVVLDCTDSCRGAVSFCVVSRRSLSIENPPILCVPSLSVTVALLVVLGGFAESGAGFGLVISPAIAALSG